MDGKWQGYSDGKWQLTFNLGIEVTLHLLIFNSIRVCKCLAVTITHIKKALVLEMMIKNIAV